MAIVDDHMKAYERELVLDEAVRRVVGRLDPDDDGAVLLECLCAVQSIGSATLSHIRAEFNRLMAGVW